MHQKHLEPAHNFAFISLAHTFQLINQVVNINLLKAFCFQQCDRSIAKPEFLFNTSDKER
jgi:hypothetical protein